MALSTPFSKSHPDFIVPKQKENEVFSECLLAHDQLRGDMYSVTYSRSSTDLCGLAGECVAQVLDQSLTVGAHLGGSTLGITELL